MVATSTIFKKTSNLSLINSQEDIPMQSGWEISNQQPGTSNQHLYVTGSKVAECTKTRQFETELCYIL